MENLNAVSGSSILSLLQETHDEALKTNSSNYEQWLRIRDEHSTLLDFLKTLPGALSRDVLVPFGCRVLMRGKLVHTNEILVRLGDGWFIKCSATHAAEICDRRINLCKEMLEKLEKEREFLLSHKELPVNQEVFGSRDQTEIIETCTEEEEAEWRASRNITNVNLGLLVQKMAPLNKTEEKGKIKIRHREKERQYRQKLAEVRTREKKPLIEKEDIWQRLDELELEEELQEELDRLHAEDGDYDEDDDDDVDYGEEVEVEEDVDNTKYSSGTKEASSTSAVIHDNSPPSEIVMKEHVNRRVSFPDEATDSVQDNVEVKRRRVSFSDKPKDIDNVDSDEELRIEFSHTPNSGTGKSELHDSNTISCPADIYDNYRRVHNKTVGLKSILKKTTSPLDEPSVSNHLPSPYEEACFANGAEDTVEESVEVEILPPVFGEVVERKVDDAQFQAPVEKRPVSRFKAARQASK